MKQIKYGIVSTAQVVPRFIAGVRQTAHGKVEAICSRQIDKAQIFAEKYQIPKYYGSEDDLFKDEAIDVIYIATYNAGHYQSAKNALLAGKNVLLEKPFTLAYQEAVELYQLASDNGLFIMEAQKSVFLPLTKLVKATIANGEIGEIISVFSVTAYASVEHIKWFKDLSAGGGTVHFMAPYALSYLPYILGKKLLDYNGVAQLKNGQADMQSMIHLSFDDDILVNIYLTTKKALPKEMRIIGSEGEIIIPEFWRGQKAEIKMNDGQLKTLEASFNNDFQYEIEHVNRRINNGKLISDVMTPELSLLGVKIMSDLYENFQKE